MILKAIIIDDEASAREGLTNLVKNYTPGVQIIAEASSITEGINILKRYKTDVVFLDIKLHPGTGFDLLEVLKGIEFDVIFTTAFDIYAVKAFRFSALDYLLKPISPSELKVSIEKVRRNKEQKRQRVLTTSNLQVLKENVNGHFKRIALPTAHGKTVIDLKEIISCEADSNYTIFHIRDQPPLITSKTLKEYQEMLGSHSFLRIQKSYLINLYHVKNYISGRGGQVEMSDGSLITISRERKKELLERLKAIG